MLSIKEKGILQYIIGHCERIEEKSKTIGLEEFIKDVDVQDIILFNLLQIGELAKKLDTSFVKTYNKVPWDNIKGMRDRIAHGYGTLTYERVWQTIIDDIKPLKDYCEELLANDK